MPPKRKAAAVGKGPEKIDSAHNANMQHDGAQTLEKTRKRAHNGKRKATEIAHENDEVCAAKKMFQIIRGLSVAVPHICTQSF